MNNQHYLDLCTRPCIDGGSTHFLDGVTTGLYGSASKRRRSVAGVFHAFVLAIVLGGLATPLPAAAQEAEGLYASCIACHGARGEGNEALGAPALAGQLPAYIDRQLVHFQQGLRGTADGDSYGAQMRPFAETLMDAQDRSTLAAYIGDMEPVGGLPVGKGDPNRGANLYNGNCGACHGGRAEGNEALNAPRLAGLDRAYVTRQLGHYREGRRGADPADRLGRQMAMMSRTITDETAINDVLSYIESLASGQ